MPNQYNVVVACHNASGEPDFVMTTVKLSKQKRDLGFHYEVAEKRALDHDYEKPMICFDEEEMPGFLKKAVKNKVIPTI